MRIASLYLCPASLVQGPLLCPLHPHAPSTRITLIPALLQHAGACLNPPAQANHCGMCCRWEDLLPSCADKKVLIIKG